MLPVSGPGAPHAVASGLPMPAADIEHQLSVFRRGADELIVESELVEKLKRGKPLRIKEGFDGSSPT